MEKVAKRTRVLIGSGVVLVLVVALVTALLTTARDHTSKGPKPISTTTTAPTSTTNPLPTSTTSTKVPPTPTAFTWSAPAKATQVNPSALTCPSVSLCVAINSVGQLFISPDPKGSTPWKLVALPGAVSNPSVSLSAISCPTASFCVAVGSGIYVSTDPAGGPNAWVSQGIAQQQGQLSSVSCSSPKLCVVLDSANNSFLISTDPTGGPKAWKATPIALFALGYSGGLYAISCPTVSLCVGVGGLGFAEISTNPTGGPKAWTKTLIDPTGGHPGGQYSNLLSTIDCVGENFCIAGDDSGGIIVTSDPTGGPSAWHVYVIPGMGGSFSCPAPSFCVVATGSSTTGLSGASINPLLGPSAWPESQAAPSGYMSCPAVSTCFLLSQNGTVQVGTAS
ncbi:MAG: hypothetical protein ACYDEP_09250 [Acidimicrobiales bacterium]